MCGIAGVRKFGDVPITGEELILLLCALEHRGPHATGIAIENPDGIFVHKAAQPAWQFTKSKEFQDFLTERLTEQTTTVLLHTRWATTGLPQKNENNHPIFDGETAIVHNGMLSNYDYLFTQGHYERICETDSDIVRAIVSAHGMEEKGVRELCKLAGSAAIACVSTKYPGKLLLARSGSPLVFGFTEAGEKLYWASESQAIIQACKPYRLVHGVWVQDTKLNMSIGSMPADSAWVFGKTEIEFHHVFNTCSFYHAPDYSKGRENYHARMRRWKKESKQKPVVVQASTYTSGHVAHYPHAVRVAAIKVPADTHADLVNAVIKCPGCGKPIQNKDGKKWEELTCPSCKSGLGN